MRLRTLHTGMLANEHGTIRGGSFLTAIAIVGTLVQWLLIAGTIPSHR